MDFLAGLRKSIITRIDCVYSMDGLWKKKIWFSPNFQEMRTRKVELRAAIPAEPDDTDVDSIRIVLKLPNGERIGRRFLKTQSAKVRTSTIHFH